MKRLPTIFLLMLLPLARAQVLSTRQGGTGYNAANKADLQAWLGIGGAAATATTARGLSIPGVPELLWDTGNSRWDFSDATVTAGAFVSDSFVGGGQDITDIKPSALTGAGQVPVAALGTGTPTAGTVLTGNGAWTASPLLTTQNANTVMAGPASGAAATPGFRALEAPDFGTALAPQFGHLGVGTAAPSGSILAVTNPAMATGVGGLDVGVTQTQVNATDTIDAAFKLSYSLSASSATNHLIGRLFNFSARNAMTGGGVLTNLRMINMSAATGPGTSTQNLDHIFIENGSAAGTVTNSYGLRIAGLQGTNKYGIYDTSGSKWYQSGTLRVDGGLSLGTSSSTYFLHLAPSAAATAGQTMFVQDATATTGATKVVVKAGAGQSTAPTALQEWQNSAGTLVTYINAWGVLTTNQAILSTLGIGNGANTANSIISFPTTGAQLTTAVAANVALTIQNTHATPSGNLTNWKATGGGVIAHVAKDGTLVSDDAATGIALKSANGHYWRITVSDAGALSTTDLGTTAP